MLSIIKDDLQAWCEWKKRNYNLYSFFIFFFKYPEFRRIIDFRLKGTAFQFFRVITYLTFKNHHLYIVCKKKVP